LMPQPPLLFKEGNVPKFNIANSFTASMTAHLYALHCRAFLT